MRDSFRIHLFSPPRHGLTAAGPRRKSPFQLLVSKISLPQTTAKTHQNSEPASATSLAHVADCDVDDFRLAIESANVAQERYFASTSAADRGAFLRRWYEAISMNVEDCKQTNSV